MTDYAEYDLVFRSLVGSAKADPVTVSQSISAASRLFDNLASVPAGFFSKAGTVVSTKTFDSTDSYILQVSPYIPGSITTINDILIADWGTVETGKPPIQFVDLRGNGTGSNFSFANDFNNCGNNFDSFNRFNRTPYYGYSGYFRSYKIAIEALWGFEEIPSDVVSATVQLAIKLLRDADPATIKMADLGEYQPQAVPPLVAAIAKNYRQMDLVRN